MYEHSAGYTVGAALELARNTKNGPLPGPGDPTPTPEDSIEIIRQERRTCGFNWITGEVAEDVLRAFVAGINTPKVANPFPDWSDEYRAWQEGHATHGGGLEQGGNNAR